MDGEIGEEGILAGPAPSSGCVVRVVWCFTISVVTLTT